MIRIRWPIPIVIHPLFWLLAGLIGLLYGRWLLGDYSVGGTLVCVGMILISVLFHEFGHALTGMAFGQKARIQLLAFGGATIREGKKISSFREFLVILDGPLFGFALAGICYLLLQSFVEIPLLVKLAFQFGLIINLFWSAANLLPILPLDGGHLLRVVLEARFGVKGTRAALLTSVVIGGSLAAASFLVGYLIMGMIFALLTFESYRGWRSFRFASEADRDEDLQEAFQKTQELIQQGQVDEAIDALEAIRAQTKAGLLFYAATDQIARLLASRGDDQKAYEELQSIEGKLEAPTEILAHELAYKVGDYEGVISLGEKVFQYTPNYQIAFRNAVAYSSVKDVRPAVGWLQRSIEEGLPNPREAIASSLFDSIREETDFNSVVRSLEKKES